MQYTFGRNQIHHARSLLGRQPETQGGVPHRRDLRAFIPVTIDHATEVGPTNRCPRAENDDFRLQVLDSLTSVRVGVHDRLLNCVSRER